MARQQCKVKNTQQLKDSLEQTHGKARHLRHLEGEARPARHGTARQTKARQGKGRQGKARQGKARHLNDIKGAGGWPILPLGEGVDMGEPADSLPLKPRQLRQDMLPLCTWSIPFTV